MDYKGIGYLIPIKKGTKTPSRAWKDYHGAVVDFTATQLLDHDVAIVPKDGILILDVDNKDGRNGNQSLEDLGLTLSDTLTQQTKNGYHLFYRIPTPCPLKQTVDIFDGIDLRTPNMGYVIYKDCWLDIEEEDVGIDKIALLSENVLQTMIDRQLDKKRSKSIVFNDEIITANRNSTLTSIAGEIWAVGATPSDLADKIHGINARRCKTPLDAKEVDAIIRSVTSYARDEPVDAEDAKQIANAILGHYFDKINKENIKNDIVEFPAHLCNVTGLLKTLTDAINASGQYITPHLSLACAVALVGCLGGKNYESPTGARTNLYIVGLGMAGAGKEAARRFVINSLSCFEEGVKILGGANIKSGAGLIKAITKNSQKLYMLDEFGLVLQSISNDRSPQYLRDIAKLLLEFYSASSSSFLGSDAASEETASGIINNPILSIYGTSTPSTFYKSITDQNVISGELPRYIVVDDPSTHKIDNKNLIKPDYGAISETIQSLMNATKSQTSDLSKYFDKVVTIEYKNQYVESIYLDFRSDINTKYTDELSNGLWSRACENVQKLASIRAISDDHKTPIITADHIQWAIDLVTYSLKLVESRLKTAITSKYGETRQKLLFFISQSKKGVTKTQIIKYMQMKSADLKDLLVDLIETGDIDSKKITSKSCRPITVFFKT